MNLLLEEWGYLRLPPLSRMTRSGFIAGLGQRLARRVVPRKTLLSAKARIGRGIRWDETEAFASQVAEQGIHINRREELPSGWVDGPRADRLEQELVERLSSLTDPTDGQPAVDRVVERDEVIRGPFARRAPHLFPILRDQRFELSDTLAATGVFTDHRDRPWGYHHLDGIFVAAGPHLVSGTYDPGIEIVDVLPTVFSAAGFHVPAGLDGRVVGEVLSTEHDAEPIAAIPGGSTSDDDEVPDYPYTPEEEAAVEEALRGLGYIE